LFIVIQPLINVDITIEEPGVLIAAIEHQSIKARKPSNDRPADSKILEFTVAALGRPREMKRPSWRAVQPFRRPKRFANSATVRAFDISRSAARAQKAPRDLRDVLKNVSRTDLILAGALALCLLIPLGFRLPLLSPEQSEIELPVAEDIVAAMFQYVVPEEQGQPETVPREGEIIESVKTTSYTVGSGDTISAIAQRFNLRMDTVISFNGIQDARSLKVGTALVIPNSNGLKYKVRRGDYLGSIAKKFGVGLNELLDWNRLESSVIIPGQDLFIPDARLSEMERNRVFGRLFIYPTKGRITDRFGMRRDPFTGMRRFHNGIDLAGRVGTPVLASMSGKVAMLGYNPTYGKYVILTHPEGFQTLYGHLDVFRVQKGQTVKQGQRIADMGNSGYSTGSHLHFSIFRRGEPIDPFRYLR
jgi:murein DD-endopeptidase MepM/ murein hydrolase activator NlpD